MKYITDGALPAPLCMQLSTSVKLAVLGLMPICSVMRLFTSMMMVRNQTSPSLQRIDVDI